MLMTRAVTSSSATAFFTNRFDGTIRALFACVQVVFLGVVLLLSLLLAITVTAGVLLSLVYAINLSARVQLETHRLSTPVIRHLPT